MKLKAVLLIIIVLVLSSMLSGCYLWEGVESYQVGLVMPDGVKVEQVLGPGRYSNGGFFADLKTMNCPSVTINWQGKDLWTKDKQPLDLDIAVTIKRMTNADSVKKMWNDYNNEARNDAALQRLVLTKVPSVAKQITTNFTLDEMLGVADEAKDSIKKQGREAVIDDMSVILSRELAKIHVELLDVKINNINADKGYRDKLAEKATSKVAAEVAKTKTLQIEEQLKQEKAQTLVDLEIASRKNKVIAEENKVYQLNPQAFQLEKLRILRDTIGDNDKLIFMEKGTDLTMLFGQGSGFVPLDSNKE